MSHIRSSTTAAENNREKTTENAKAAVDAEWKRRTAICVAIAATGIGERITVILDGVRGRWSNEGATRKNEGA